MYLSIAGALNIALNLFFVIVCQLSVMCVALASAISQCASAGLILHALTLSLIHIYGILLPLQPDHG